MVGDATETHIENSHKAAQTDRNGRVKPVTSNLKVLVQQQVGQIRTTSIYNVMFK